MGIEQEGPIEILEDNQSTIAITEGNTTNARTRHVGIHTGFLQELVRNKQVYFKWCQTKEMVADTLTKPLDVKDFIRHRQALGLRDGGVLEVASNEQ